MHTLQFFFEHKKYSQGMTYLEMGDHAVLTLKVVLDLWPHFK
jgi:hypothetical protein